MCAWTVGRRSGKERAVILGYFEDGPNLVTLAMNGWGEGEPAWWLNLQADPDATVELPEARAGPGRAAEGEERERLWARWQQIDKRPRRLRRASLPADGGRRPRAALTATGRPRFRRPAYGKQGSSSRSSASRAGGSFSSRETRDVLGGVRARASLHNVPKDSSPARPVGMQAAARIWASRSADKVASFDGSARSAGRAPGGFAAAPSYETSSPTPFALRLLDG